MSPTPSSMTNPSPANAPMYDDVVENVRPLLPTILADLPALPIPGTDLIFASIEGGFVFPGTVSRPQLTAALARTLQLYPHASGRLLQDPQTHVWRIALLNAPLTLTFSTAPPDFDSTDAKCFEERNPIFVDLVTFGFAPMSSETEPVVKLKVVYYPLTHESSVFLSWCHALGDGTTAYGFLHTLARLYHDQEAVHVPTYEKYVGPPAPPLERHLLYETLKEVPHLAVDYDKETFYGMYGRMLGETERVDLQFGEKELAAIRKAARKGVRGGGEEISTRDALSAYLITVLNRVTPETPVRRIMNVVDFRGAPLSTVNPNYNPPSRTAAGNLTLTHFIDIPTSDLPSCSKSSHAPSTSSLMPTATHTSHIPLSTLAQTIHRSVSIPRTDGEHVRRVVALSEELYARSTKAGRLQWWFPYIPGEGFDGSNDTHQGVTAAVNNLSNVDFPAIHYSESSRMGRQRENEREIRSRFYTFDSWAHYLRIWKGNPLPVYENESLEDTFPAAESLSPESVQSPSIPSHPEQLHTKRRRIVAWKLERNALRVFFRVRAGRKSMVEEIVKRDLERVGSGQDLGAGVTGFVVDEERRGWFGSWLKAKL